MIRNSARLVLTLALLLAPLTAHAEAEIGQPAPALSVIEIGEAKFDLAAEKGKVVIVHFWATWCPSCREEMPVLNNFYRQYHTHGVDMIALSADTPRHRPDVETFMRDYNFPAALITDASANGFGQPKAIPVTYIIDRKGMVRAEITPDKAELTQETLFAAIMPLLTQ